MALSLSVAQWTELASKLFLLQPATTTKLPKPATSTVGGGLSAKLDLLKTDPLSKDLGIGVVDFTAGISSDVVWLNNADVAWRAGSTAKIAILLAALQLRDDVRVAQAFVSKPDDFDELFASPKLWGMSKIDKANQIVGRDHAPRISTIFDLSKSPAEFLGPDADNPNFTDIVNRVTTQTPHGHLQWPLVTDFDFTERLWLAGARSDNVAATSCISEIGVAYIKAVQRAYGLFDPPNGLKLLLAGPYTSGVDTTVPVSNASATIKYRALPSSDIEKPKVTDALKTAPGRFEDQQSWEGTSVAALTAYMIALMQDELVAFGHGLSFGTIGCNTIRANLSHGPVNVGTRSFLVQGINTVAKVTKQITKIGLLGIEDGEPGPLNCEFAYVETEENSAPVGGTPKVMKYGILVTGIKSTDNTATHHATNITANVGAFIHQALARP